MAINVTDAIGTVAYVRSITTKSGKPMCTFEFSQRSVGKKDGSVTWENWRAIAFGDTADKLAALKDRTVVRINNGVLKTEVYDSKKVVTLYVNDFSEYQTSSVVSSDVTVEAAA